LILLLVLFRNVFACYKLSIVSSV